MTLLYLPMRLVWRRERLAVRAALARGDPLCEEFLARRAVAGAPYDRLVAAAADPWGELAARRFAVLADLELARLGLERPPSGA
jgi:hypothetical protein